MDIQTLQGQPVSRLGLGGHQTMETEFVSIAYGAGINYFFFYNLSYRPLLEGLKPILADNRETVAIATGSVDRDPVNLRRYLDQVRRQLETDMIDVFFVEYVSPSDDIDQVHTLLDELHDWKRKGWIRYVGATAHSRPLSVDLIQGEQCEVLMHRYNMAHRSAEETVLPTALGVESPIVAFTCTRWGALLKGHPNWSGAVPRATDCYRFCLHHPAIRLALTAPATKAELEENLTVLSASKLSPEEITNWRAYGDLIYGTGQDTFETKWL
ncbi:MAG: aldo/keto reductase [Leptolyngbyaceae cyanobacterium MO_188.B28]|nr:aldo/keto reductase [Leptolyngbyaceae cyanobacterium MO_188.B28]